MGMGKLCFSCCFFSQNFEAWGQIPTMVFSDKLGDVYPGGRAGNFTKSTFDMLCQL